MKKQIILIYGLPGSGKTTLANQLFKKLKNNSIWFNADKVRSTLSKDLGFTEDDRQEQARRMGCLASLALEGSSVQYSIVDFVNPTVQTYKTFLINSKLPIGKKIDDNFKVPNSFLNEIDYQVFSIFMDTINKDKSKYADTNALFDNALDVRKPDIHVNEYLNSENEFSLLADKIISTLNNN